MEMVMVQSMSLPRVSLRGVSMNLRSCVAVAVLACLAMVSTGCSQESWNTVVSQVDAQIPVAQSFVTTSSAAAVAVAQTVDPPVAVIIQTTTDSVQAGLVVVKALCDAYLQSKDATVLGKINAALNDLLNKNAAALLNAAHIENTVSRGIATVVLGGLLSTLQLLYAILQRAQTKAQVTQTVAMRTFKLMDVAPYLDQQRIERASGQPFGVALQYEVAQGF